MVAEWRRSLTLLFLLRLLAVVVCHCLQFISTCCRLLLQSLTSRSVRCLPFQASLPSEKEIRKTPRAAKTQGCDTPARGPPSTTSPRSSSRFPCCCNPPRSWLSFIFRAPPQVAPASPSCCRLLPPRTLFHLPPPPNASVPLPPPQQRQRAYK